MGDKGSGGDTTPADVNDPVFTTEEEQSIFIDRLVEAEIASEKARELKMILGELRAIARRREEQERKLREQQRNAKQQDFERRQRIGYEQLNYDEREKKRRKMEQREKKVLEVAEILVGMAKRTKPSLRL